MPFWFGGWKGAPLRYYPKIKGLPDPTPCPPSKCGRCRLVITSVKYNIPACVSCALIVDAIVEGRSGVF